MTLLSNVTADFERLTLTASEARRLMYDHGWEQRTIELLWCDGRSPREPFKVGKYLVTIGANK